MVTKDDMRQAKIMRLASKIMSDLAPWEQDDLNYHHVVKTLSKDPLVVVDYLVSRFIEE